MACVGVMCACVRVEKHRLLDPVSLKEQVPRSSAPFEFALPMWATPLATHTHLTTSPEHLPLTQHLGRQDAINSLARQPHALIGLCRGVGAQAADVPHQDALQAVGKGVPVWAGCQGCSA